MPFAAVCADLGVAAFISVFVTIMGYSIAKSPDHWYDIFNRYGQFPPEYTNIIDDILSNEDFSVLGNAEMVARGKSRPKKGKHYFYMHHKSQRNSWWRPSHRYRRWRYVGLEKKIDKDDKDKGEYYIFWVMKRNMDVLQKLAALIFPRDLNKLMVRSIDTSDSKPKICIKLVSLRPAQPHQEQALAYIQDHWAQTSDKNTKVLVSGPRGSGKTYLGKLLKYALDEADDRVAHYFDNFDPTMIGVNIQTMVLNMASEHSPVILIINEVDDFYKEVYEGEPSFDPRGHYCKNRNTFNNMLDNFGESPHTIIIFTTEKSPEQLYQEERYRSFIRPGRVDMFLEMTNDTIVKKTHREIGF